MILPWQRQQWQQLWYARIANRMPHALLFSGAEGTGKTAFADEFTQALLCDRNQTALLSERNANEVTACGTCHACRTVANRSHLSVRWIEPEKEGHAIKIDQVREISEFINQTTIQGEYRVVILRPADSMNTNAANALLKTLEEPSSGALLILVSNQKGRLPATIASRCQHIAFPCPDNAEALQWLKSELTPRDGNVADAERLLRLANGAPLTALKMAQEDQLSSRQLLFDSLFALSQRQADPLKSAEKCQTMETLPWLDFMLSCVADVMKLQLGANPEQLVNRDYAPSLQAHSASRQLSKTTRLFTLLQQMRAQVCVGLNLNKQLMVEQVLLAWME